MVTLRCGGHITLLFSIWKEGRLPRSQGSRGAGFCIDQGCEVSIRHIGTNSSDYQGELSAGERLDIQPSQAPDGEIRVKVCGMDGVEMENCEGMYLDLVEGLRQATLLNRPDSYSIDVQLELPTSQGFGMSAAGLVATALAFMELTGKGRKSQYMRLAHRIEREYGAGLGDVLGLSAGGVELRLEAGAPYSPGIAKGFPANCELLLVWSNEESRHTSSYIDDPLWMPKITKAGEDSVKRLRVGQWDASKWDALMRESRDFAKASEMMDEPARKELLDQVQSTIRSLDLQAEVYTRLCMLGVSVAILPRKLQSGLSDDQLSDLSEAIRKIGLGVRRCKIE